MGDDPQSFLEKLASAGAPLAKKRAIMLLKPKLAPYLEKQGLEWVDVVPMLELVDSTEELQAAVDDPQSFLEKLASVNAPGPSPGETKALSQFVRTKGQCECIFP